MEIDKKEYDEYVKTVTPTHSTWKNVGRAFLVGGGICLLGQVLTGLFLNWGMEKEEASAWTTLCLIAGSVILTGLNLYPRLVKFGGAGALVPITGFANSVTSPAIEFRTEGFIYGTAAKMFTVAGAIIVYGVFSGVIVGIIYYFL